MEKKKNNDSFSVLCYPVNRQCLPRKIQIEKEKKAERKNEKNANKTQIKLNAPHVMDHVKMLPNN